MVLFKGTRKKEIAMRTTHTYKPKYSHSISRTNAQKKKDSRVMGSRRRHEEDRDWNAEEAVGEWGSRMANVMHSLETGQYVPDTGWYEIGLQAKLTIGQPGDKYEQEADRVARQVVQQINSPRIIEEEELGRPKQEIQRKGLTGGTLAPQNFEGSIKEARGRGKPLSDKIRKPLEQAMGADFSGVRVHTDAQSDQLNQSIQAKAFTTGQDVFFRQGAYQPKSRGGQELIAHELTHVVQQTSSSGVRQRKEQIRPWETKNMYPAHSQSRQDLAIHWYKPAESNERCPEINREGEAPARQSYYRDTANVGYNPPTSSSKQYLDPKNAQIGVIQGMFRGGRVLREAIGNVGKTAMGFMSRHVSLPGKTAQQHTDNRDNISGSYNTVFSSEEYTNLLRIVERTDRSEIVEYPVNKMNILCVKDVQFTQVHKSNPTLTKNGKGTVWLKMDKDNDGKPMIFGVGNAKLD
ncbi:MULTISPECIES: DUF4157 domain-containing protein [Moorena]|nr:MULTISPECIES: DUF4157 domain-containing protein [Moorena]